MSTQVNTEQELRENITSVNHNTLWWCCWEEQGE